MNKLEKWDRRFIALAQMVSGWSKDPSTQVGAVIVDRDRRVVSLGFNGFPRNVQDTQDRYDNRDLKYKLTVHAEMNAILFAQRSIEGCRLYTWPFMPCARCATAIIQAKIVDVVAPKMAEEDPRYQRWAQDFLLSQQMFIEAGIPIRLLENKNG